MSPRMAMRLVLTRGGQRQTAPLASITRTVKTRNDSDLDRLALEHELMATGTYDLLLLSVLGLFRLVRISFSLEITLLLYNFRDT
jgi:hypothetical protein